MSSLLRSTRTMAVGTVASRTTGFLRTAVLAAALGGGPVGNAFNVANTAPNIVYDLLLGGILSSVIVPLLVRALKAGTAQGHAYTQRLLGLTLVGLGGVVALLVVAAPLVLRVYLPPSTPYFHLTVVFAIFFFPQVLFYGLGAVLGAYLNAQGRFGPPMWAPVLNNVVVIATGLLFLLLPSPHVLTAQTITDTQVAVIGVGVTFGILAQTVALIPALRATGLSLRPRFDFRGTGLGSAAQLARWTLLYVVCNQLVLVAVIQLANSVRPGHGATYSYYVFAYLLWQLPHAVVAVSIITALLPEMSRAAADQRIADLRRQLDRGLRLTVAVLVPASLAYIVLGQPLATLVFGYGRTGLAGANDVASLLVVFSLGLVAFSAYQLQLRAFYALQDTRTPALVNLVINATTVVVDITLYLLLPEQQRVMGLAAGQTVSYLVGVVVCTRVLSRRVPTDPEGHVLRTTARCVLAAAGPGLVAFAVVQAVTRTVGPGQLGALLSATVGGAVLGAGYVLGARRVRVPEVAALTGPVLSRLVR